MGLHYWCYRCKFLSFAHRYMSSVLGDVSSISSGKKKFLHLSVCTFFLFVETDNVFTVMHLKKKPQSLWGRTDRSELGKCLPVKNEAVENSVSDIKVGFCFWDWNSFSNGGHSSISFSLSRSLVSPCTVCFGVICVMHLNIFSWCLFCLHKHVYWA